MLETLRINSILKDFYAISGIRISLHDTEFNEIFSYPKEPSEFCRSVQKFDYVLQDCHKNDQTAFQKVKNTGEVYIYKCNRGLFEAVAPIYHYGILSGYLMMGQISDNSAQSKDYIINRIFEITGNKSAALSLSSTVKTIDKDLIYSYINIMTVLAEYLTSANKLFLYDKNLPQLVAEYIDKNYSRKITLSILSQKFECCNATLTNNFKKEYNMSIMSYLCQVRLKNAKEMILKSRKSFKEIAFECGFYDQNYFSKTFTKHYGCSPSQFKEKQTLNNLKKF